MEYLRLSRKYFKQNIRILYLLILSIAIGVALVFSFQVAKRSQAINNMNYINEISPTYNAEARNLDIKTTELLKNHENVKSIEISKNFGQFIYNKTGIALSLNEYNANVIKSSKLKLIDGREPKNSNEIIIDKELASSSNLKIGDSINGFIRKEYVSNGSNDLFMNNKSFKIVGIVQPKYDTDQIHIYTTLGKEENLIPKEAIGYDSTINLKSGFSDLLSNVNKLGRDVGESQNTILANELHQKLTEEINSESIESPDLEKVIIASILFVSSVFGLFMRKRLKDIGLIRIVGGSKRGFSLSIIFEHLFIAFLGCVLGLILGYIIAIFLNKYVYLSSIDSLVSVENRQLYLKWKDIILAIKLSLANVSISMIIQLIAINFSEKLDLIKEKNCFDKKIENINLSRMNLCFIKKITTKLAFKNFTRSFIPMSISIIVVMLAGGRWIDLSITQNMDKSDIPTIAISSFQSRDNKLTKNVYYDCLYGINENDLQKLKNIDGVSNILKLKKFNGYGVIPQDMLSDEIKSDNNEQGSSDELLFTISGYEKDYFKNKDILSSGGYEDLDKNELSALVTENFYDRYNGRKNSKIFKDLKVGDIIKVKLPVMENKLQKYKTFDVKVAGVLNEKWSMYKDCPSKYGEIVFDINKLNDITNSNTYTTLKFDNSGNLNDIKSSFNEKDYSIENIKDLGEGYLKSPDEFYYQLIVITIFLMIIAFANIYSAIKGSIMLRKKEISITRALGASQNTIYKMVIKESLIYGFICAMAGCVYGFLSAYNYYELSVKASNQVSGFSTIKFEIPILQVITLFMLILIFCFIIVNISLKTILKEDIINGIRNGE